MGQSRATHRFTGYTYTTLPGTGYTLPRSRHDYQHHLPTHNRRPPRSRRYFPPKFALYNKPIYVAALTVHRCLSSPLLR